MQAGTGKGLDSDGVPAYNGRAERRDIRRWIECAALAIGGRQPGGVTRFRISARVLIMGMSASAFWC